MSLIQRYQLLVERLPGVTYINDVDSFRTRYISPQVREVLGYEPDEFLRSGLKLAALVHPDDREQAVAAMRALRISGGSTLASYRMIARDGSVRWIEDFADVVPGDDGIPIHVQGHLRDVTEARELARMKDEFVALVSHELRTPLTPILGWIEMLRQTTLDSEQQAAFTVIERNALRLQRIVGDLLFVARLDAGSLEMEPTKIDLAAVIRDAVDAATPQAERNKISIETKLPGVCGMVGDGTRLGQVIDNLISNALKFTPEDGTITVTLEHRPAGRAILTVGDTGIGIPKDEQRQLFQRFFRSSTAIDRAIQGTGLGLAISKAIIEAHGGSISCSSSAGVGTTFRIELPTAAVHHVAA